MRLNPLFTVLCLWIRFVLYVFTCLKRIHVHPCHFQLLVFLIHPYTWSKASRLLPTSPQLEFCKDLALSPDPKLFFPISPTKIQKTKIKHSYLFTSLKSVFIFHYKSSHPLWKPFAEIDRREPSPVLVGLATRLSVVWCGLEFYLISAWGRFER